MHNAKNCVLLVWRAERAYFCTENAIRRVFGCLVWVGLKCAMPKNVCSWCGAPKYLFTTVANKIVFGYLVWVCLTCTVPKNV